MIRAIQPGKPQVLNLCHQSFPARPGQTPLPLNLHRKRHHLCCCLLFIQRMPRFTTEQSARKTTDPLEYYFLLCYILRYFVEFSTSWRGGFLLPVVALAHVTPLGRTPYGKGVRYEDTPYLGASEHLMTARLEQVEAHF